MAVRPPFERKATLLLSIHDVREAPTALEVHRFIGVELGLKLEDILVIQFGYYRKQVFVKLRDESLVDAVLKEKVGALDFPSSGNKKGTVTLESASVRATFVKVASLPPEIPRSEVEKELIKYGKIVNYFENRWGGEGLMLVKTGTRTVKMFLNHPIPSQIPIGGAKAVIHYVGQPQTCSRCGQEGHLRLKCTSAPVRSGYADALRGSTRLEEEEKIRGEIEMEDRIAEGVGGVSEGTQVMDIDRNEGGLSTTDGMTEVEDVGAEGEGAGLGSKRRKRRKHSGRHKKKTSAADPLNVDIGRTGSGEGVITAREGDTGVGEGEKNFRTGSLGEDSASDRTGNEREVEGAVHMAAVKKGTWETTATETEVSAIDTGARKERTMGGECAKSSALGEGERRQFATDLVADKKGADGTLDAGEEVVDGHLAVMKWDTVAGKGRAGGWTGREEGQTSPCSGDGGVGDGKGGDGVGLAEADEGEHADGDRKKTGMAAAPGTTVKPVTETGAGGQRPASGRFWYESDSGPEEETGSDLTGPLTDRRSAIKQWREKFGYMKKRRPQTEAREGGQR